MQELIKKNTLSNVDSYLKYTSDIFRLASKHVWYSVLLYDREYREKQAEEHFEWGVYRQDLREFNLVLKRDNPTSRAIGAVQNQGQASSGGRNSYNGNNINHPADRRKGPFTSDGREICRNFNNNGCSRVDCKMAHTCAVCLSRSHSAAEGHTKQTPKNE